MQNVPEFPIVPGFLDSVIYIRVCARKKIFFVLRAYIYKKHREHREHREQKSEKP